MGRISTRSTEAAIGSVIGGLIGMGFQGIHAKRQRVQLYSDADTTRYLEKLNQELAACVLSVTFDSPTQERLQSFARIFGAVQTLSSAEIQIKPGYTSPVIPIPTFDAWFFKTPLGFIDGLPTKGEGALEERNQYLFILTDEELSALWHLAHAGFPSDLLDTRGMHVAVPRGLKMSSDGVKMGVNRVGAR